MKSLNEQQNFWANDYANAYIEKNNSFDLNLGIEAWGKMLNQTCNLSSISECGCNIGRNISFLNSLLPETRKSIIEISKPAFEFVTASYKLDKSFNGSIIDSQFKSGSFDLIFTCGVLIHIHPDDLLVNMKKMFEYSSKYVLIGEYFNRTPLMIEYQGQTNKLFKRDIGKFFLSNFSARCIDYGFLWGHVYDKAGFDDITWWLFEKE